MDTDGAERRGDGHVPPHGDGHPGSRKKAKVEEQVAKVCKPQWKKTSPCSCNPQGHAVSTWSGWDDHGTYLLYCEQCWSEYFQERAATEDEDPDADPDGEVPKIAQALQGLNVSSTG